MPDATPRPANVLLCSARHPGLLGHEVIGAQMADYYLGNVTHMHACIRATTSASYIA